MGASHARLLVQEGAKVVIGDLLDEDGTALAAELGEDNARYVHLDVTDYAQWEAAVAAATEAFGRLDIVVNNAGIANFGPIEDYTIDAWQKIIDINLTGVFYGIKAAIPALKESGAGSIINISSTAGLQGYEALPGYEEVLRRAGRRMAPPFTVRTLSLAVGSLFDGLTLRRAVDPDTVPDDLGPPPGVPAASSDERWDTFSALAHVLLMGMTEPDPTAP